jgi:rubrerythrin
VEVGKRLAEEVRKLPVDAEGRERAAREALAEKTAQIREAEREVDQKKKVALGQFDGRCPVADIQCPARARINEGRELSASALREAEGRRDLLKKQREKIFDAAEAASDVASDLRAKMKDLDRLRQRAVDMQPEARLAAKHLRKHPAPEPTAFDMAGMRRIHDEAVRAIADARARREQKEKLEAELRLVEEKIARASDDVAVSVSAQKVFRAAQRRIAERALDQIGASAGRMMRESGIDLSVAVRWEREGKNLARACEVCGTPFPSSAKVRECGGCGAERGQAVVQRLEFLLSNRSGAADDLAGVAIQLAAGSWLLRQRSSPWACAMLDEPLAACDRTNRRALAGQLIKLLGSGTWRQAVVVSHSPDVTDLYPGRIEIVVARDGTRKIIQT